MKENYKKWIAGLLATLGIGGAVTFGGAINTPTAGEYQIISGVQGYVTKTDMTVTPPNYLVSGSQNVIINDQEKVETRAGYELFGVASTSAEAITSDFVWRNSGATSTLPSEIFLRASGNVLQYYATSTWEDLFTQVSTTSPIRFASVWNNTEKLDALLFVNASSTLFEWSGGQGILSATTTNTIVISGVIGESRFLINGTRKIRIKGGDGTWRTYTYTGQSASTFTGVTPDPSTNLEVGATVVQDVRSNTNKPDTGYVSNFIEVLNNQVWIGSETSRIVYISKNTDYTSYAFSTPRVAGEGALLTLDDTTVGLKAPDNNKMLIFSGKDRVYQSYFQTTAGATSDREQIEAQPLLVSSGQGAMSQELIAKIKQAVVWISNNKELVEYGQVENLPGPQAVAISDPIKPTFASSDFTDGDIEFWRNQIFITVPNDGKMYIFDFSKRFWQSPQTIGVRRLSQYGDALYGHGQSVPETYKLFTGLNDNGNPIQAKAHFGYINNGSRVALKNFNRFFTEMYLASNTKVNVTILYDWLGSKGETTYELDGSTQDFLFVPTQNASLGVNSMGVNPLGSLTSLSVDLPKYRRFKPIVPKDYFEYQVRIESDGTDYAWQTLAFGSNSVLSENVIQKIIK